MCASHECCEAVQLWLSYLPCFCWSSSLPYAKVRVFAVSYIGFYINIRCACRHAAYNLTCNTALQRQTKVHHEALVEAGLLQLEPITSTTGPWQPCLPACRCRKRRRRRRRPGCGPRRRRCSAGGAAAAGSRRCRRGGRERPSRPTRATWARSTPATGGAQLCAHRDFTCTQVFVCRNLRGRFEQQQKAGKPKGLVIKACFA